LVRLRSGKENSDLRHLKALAPGELTKTNNGTRVRVIGRIQCCVQEMLDEKTEMMVR
jgi:hypothetical protein